MPFTTVKVIEGVFSKEQKAEDMEHINVLEEVHWAATSIPTHSLNCDKVFIAYIDTDKNDRIRPAELKSAWSWVVQILSDRHRLSEGSDILRLQDIDTNHLEGQKLHATAKLILTNLNIPGKNEISLAQVRDVQSIMASADWIYDNVHNFGIPFASINSKENTAFSNVQSF